VTRVSSSFCQNTHDEQARVFQAVAKFGIKDILAKITKDILVFLPSFDSDNNKDYGCTRPARRRGNELLRTLPERAGHLLQCVL